MTTSMKLSFFILSLLLILVALVQVHLADAEQPLVGNVVTLNQPSVDAP